MRKIYFDIEPMTGLDLNIEFCLNDAVWDASHSWDLELNAGEDSYHYADNFAAAVKVFCDTFGLARVPNHHTLCTLKSDTLRAMGDLYSDAYVDAVIQRIGDYCLDAVRSNAPVRPHKVYYVDRSEKSCEAYAATHVCVEYTEKQAWAFAKEFRHYFGCETIKECFEDYPIEEIAPTDWEVGKLDWQYWECHDDGNEYFSERFKEVSEALTEADDERHAHQTKLKAWIRHCAPVQHRKPLFGGVDHG
jgi:hypothetical protein